MCGIFGFITKKSSKLNPASLKLTINKLFLLSESRGKEVAGLAYLYGDRIQVFKQPVKPNLLIRQKEYKRFIQGLNSPCAVIGHARLVTEGRSENNENNQPIIKNGLVGVHNGIIVNDGEMWSTFSSMKKEFDVDSEVILSLLSFFSKSGKNILQATQETFSLIQGAASIAVFFNDIDSLLLATNNGSLYTCISRKADLFIFTSERYFLEKLYLLPYLRKVLGETEIRHIASGYGCTVGISDLSVEEFSLKNKESSILSNIKSMTKKEICDFSPRNNSTNKFKEKRLNLKLPEILGFEEEFRRDELRVSLLKRCKRCILPETMPFIEFDEEGVCNFCRNYKKPEFLGRGHLEKIISQYRVNSNESNCIVGLSGGRDSSYGLHYVKTVLKLNPIAYTYDWGMITDLARRNISRICGKLGIEHILISADIIQKRRFIKKNVESWLKRPHLGMIPLFMAGDKHYFYFIKKLKKQMRINLTIFNENPLERTDFKTGFSGVKQGDFDKSHMYRLSYVLSFMNKIRLASFYGKQYLLNPSYINLSLLDTLSAYACYYLLPRDYLNLYAFIPWEEEKVLSTVIGEYGWEGDPDTKATWRIGDGTASFYNFIYYTVAGFTENDTFRSNQIRSGMLTRQKALEHIKEENAPRFNSIYWYCKTIGIDFINSLRVINSVPKLYPKLK